MNDDEKINHEDSEPLEEQGGSPEPPSPDSTRKFSSLDTLEESVELMQEIKATHSAGAFITSSSGSNI